MDQTISVKLPGLEGIYEYELVEGFKFHVTESPVPALYRYQGCSDRVNCFLVAREFTGAQHDRIIRICRAFQEEKGSQDEVETQKRTPQQGGRARVAQVYGLDVSQRYCLTKFIRWNHEHGNTQEPGDYKPAQTLAEYVQRHNKRRMSLAEAYGFISQVASALHWLADKGGHGDVQESNVLVQKSGRAVLIDPKYEELDASVADLKQLDALFLFLLTGISTHSFETADREWQRQEKRIAEDDRKAVAAARMALKETATAGQTDSRAVQAALERFLAYLVEAPSVTPLPFPASFGLLLSRGIFGLVLGAVLMALGVSMLLASAALPPVSQKWVTAPPPLTPIPTGIVEATPSLVPELVTTTLTTTPAPDDTPTTPDTPTPVPTTPAPIATKTPTPTPGSIVDKPPIGTKVSASPTPAFPLDKMPDDCVSNEEALENKGFGFIKPLSHQDSYGGRVIVKVDDSLNYTVRAMAIGQLPVTRNINDWRTIEECQMLDADHVRCQRDIPSLNEHSERWDPHGYLYVDWQGTDNGRYGLLLQVERREDERIFRQYCAYVYDVTYRSGPVVR